MHRRRGFNRRGRPGNDPYSTQQLGGVSMNAPFIENGVYKFIGKPVQFEQSTNQLDQEPNLGSVKDINISIEGHTTSGFDRCCFCATLILGSIFIFPLFFICCSWWKKIVYPTYNVPMSSYEALRKLLALNNIQTLTLAVTDHQLSLQKIQALYKIISESGIKSFTFINRAGMFDYEDNEFWDFKERMQKFKQLKMVTEIRWQHESVN